MSGLIVESGLTVRNKSLLLIFCVIILFSVETFSTEGFEINEPLPQLVEGLEKNYDGYYFVDFYRYDGDLGYSLTYEKQYEKRHYAHVYIWPAPKNISQAHHELVDYANHSALNDIRQFEAEGEYEDVLELESKVYMLNQSILKITQLSLVSEGNKLVTTLYVTEYKKYLLKVRVSMPDYIIYRGRTDNTRFALSVLDGVMKGLDAGHKF